uniref:T9SS type B sorting domain-containing protein n=1 Tax=Penaeicola halotolerans TaxID=2793196 RepID=UPI001CF8BCF6
NGKDENLAVVNVLANDRLNGVAVNPADVTLSRTSPVAGSPLTLNADGSVDVAAETAAGIYTLTYEISENLNPTNTDQATVTVEVVAAAIDAIDDDITGINGKSGANNVVNVLTNDLLNGVAVNPADVTLTRTSPVAGSPLTLNADGSVDVAAETAAGIYTLTYEISENLNPTNTDQAIVTVIVEVAEIIANDDLVENINGFEGITDAGINVLTNDLLNGVAVIPSEVTITPNTNGPLTVNADGTVSVDANTPAGTYTVTYVISENLNPSNTDQATVTVEVVAPAIVATNDTFGPVNAFDGGVAGNVLVNDTYNGAGARLTETELVFVSSTDPAVTLDLATGEISVAAGTAAGTYTLEYTLIDQLNPTNTDNAVVTVTVEGPVMEATADNFGPINGFEGVANVGNILTNDTYNGATATVSLVDITIVTPFSNGNVTLDITTGQISVAAGTAAGTYTLEYSITDKLDPSNVETTTVMVEVAAAAIEAVDDTFGPVNAFDGGVAGNVLVNDTYNGTGARLTETTLVVVSADAPLTLDITSGDIEVAAGTVAGTYTLEYTLVDQLNPTNTDNAVVTVTVEGPVMEATADNFGPINGFEGVANVGNILTNDTYNGATATVSLVDITIVTPFSNGNVTLDITTGQISVAAGTAAGTYTLEYSITDKLDPSNVETATVTVEVIAAEIEAINDNASGINGKSGANNVVNVLTNDLLNGVAVVPADVTISRTSPVADSPLTLNADGSVDVASMTAAGTYTLTYEISENLNPTNTDQAIVTVIVEVAEIIANDDLVENINGFEGITDAGINVLTNDLLNGVAVIHSEVTITPNTNGPLTVNADGTVSVDANTPAGTYSVTYEISEKLNPSNTATATVTVEVVAPVIEANDDSFGTINGFEGGLAGNVLTNDTYNSASVNTSQVSISLVSADSGLELDEMTGEVNVISGTEAGTYNLTYSIIDNLNPTNQSQALVAVVVGAPDIAAINDTYTDINGFTGGQVGNLLANDIYSGSSANIAEVSIEVVNAAPQINVDVTTGAVSVPSKTSAGTYQVVYRIVDKLNPSNVSEATITVTVLAASIEAINDTYFEVNGFTGNTNVANVLENDLLNGETVNPDDVTIAQLSSSDPAVRLIPGTGILSVAAGTEAGQYQLTYRITDNINSDNFSEAEVSIEVIAAPIVANDDTYGDINGFSGKEDVGNVLANDRFNGTASSISDVTLDVIEAASNTNVVLDINTGLVKVSPLTPAGNYTIKYRKTDKLNADNSDEATVFIEVLPAPVLAIEDDFRDVGVFEGRARTQIGNIFENDAFNEQRLDLSNVTVSIGENLDRVPDFVVIDDLGNVSVLETATPGVYTFDYTICSTLNPSSCSTASVTILVQELSIDMSISKSSFNAEIFEGTNYDYEILVENNSDFDATNVVIRDLMPNNATLVNVEYRVTNSRIVTERRFEGTDIIFEVADFPRGEQLLIILTVNAGNFGPVVNEVTVTAKENDNRPNNNRSIDRNEIKPFFIPDVITPGRADGKNDRFVINGLQKFEKNKLVIINRWNDHVYQSENYQNDWSANGLNAGTYYYVLTSIDGQGKEHIFKGWIQVIK